MDDRLTEHFRELQQSSSRPLAADVDLVRTGGYRGYTELVGRWAGIARAGGEVIEIGRSVAGAPLFAIDIGPRDAARISAIVAGLHPMEWIGVEVALELLERLVNDPPPGRRVIGFPLVNVDGYRRVEDDLRHHRPRFRRGNRHGVDLNRNWPTHFASPSWLRRKLSLGGWNHGGPRPLSEPEVAAVVNHLDRVAHSADIDRAVSLHSFGRKILTPYGGRWRAPGDAAGLRRAANAIRQRIPEPYTVTQSAHWVPGVFGHGMELDHFYASYGATSLLVECSLGGLTLRDPRSLLHPFRWFNPRRPERVVGQLATALEPFVRGIAGS